MCSECLLGYRRTWQQWRVTIMRNWPTRVKLQRRQLGRRLLLPLKLPSCWQIPLQSMTMRCKRCRLTCIPKSRHACNSLTERTAAHNKRQITTVPEELVIVIKRHSSELMAHGLVSAVRVRPGGC